MYSSLTFSSLFSMCFIDFLVRFMTFEKKEKEKKGL